MSNVIQFPDPMPPELETKKVTRCVASDPPPGYELTFECGHTVWCAIAFDPGQKINCGKCIDNFHRKAFADARTGSPGNARAIGDEDAGR